MKDADVSKKEKVIDEVLEGVQFLLGHSRAGQVELRRSDGMEYRRWVVEHFKIIYRIDGERIIVTDLFDSRQDPRNIKI